MGFEDGQDVQDAARLEEIANQAMLMAAAERVLGREMRALSREGIAVSAIHRRTEVVEGRRSIISDTEVVRLRGMLAPRQAATERMLRAGLNLPGMADTARAVIEDVARTGRIPDDSLGLGI